MKHTMIATAVALFGAAGAQAANSADDESLPVHPRGFELRDANGKLMGQYSPAFIQIFVGDKRYAIYTTPAIQGNGVLSTVELDYQQPEFFLYTTSDCTGTPYVYSSFFGAAFAFPVINATTGQVLLYPASETAENITYNSGAWLPNPVCQHSPGTEVVVALKPPVDITNLYKRPFHIR